MMVFAKSNEAGIGVVVRNDKREVLNMTYAIFWKIKIKMTYAIFWFFSYLNKMTYAIFQK